MIHYTLDLVHVLYARDSTICYFASRPSSARSIHASPGIISVIWYAPRTTNHHVAAICHYYAHTSGPIQRAMAGPFLQQCNRGSIIQIAIIVNVILISFEKCGSYKFNQIISRLLETQVRNTFHEKITDTLYLARTLIIGRFAEVCLCEIAN